jgi:hypothetical protein
MLFISHATATRHAQSLLRTGKCKSYAIQFATMQNRDGTKDQGYVVIQK